MKRQLIKTTALALGAFMIAASAIGCGKTGYKLKSKELTDSKTTVRGSDVGSNINNYKANIEGAQNFAFELLKQSVTDHKTTVISPVSVMAAIGLTANGASGDTLSQIQTVLGQDDMDKFNDMCSYFMSSQDSDKDSSKVTIANSIWIKDSNAKEVKKDFLDTASGKYGAQIFSTVFDSTTVDDINKWVNNSTDGIIDHMVDEISEDDIMYLVNAVAFDAVWEVPYESGSIIEDAQFTDVDGKISKVKLMQSDESLGIYNENDDAIGFVKPYAGNYSFVALLPEESEDIWTYVNNLDGKTFAKYVESAGKRKVTAFIPEFETSFETDMKEVLEQMGVKDIFDDSKADLSAMLSDSARTAVKKIIHKTEITVNEKGTKAASASYVDVVTRDRTDVRLDRPFVYAVIDNTTNIPLYLGVVTSL